MGHQNVVRLPQFGHLGLRLGRQIEQAVADVQWLKRCSTSAWTTVASLFIAAVEHKLLGLLGIFTGDLGTRYNIYLEGPKDERVLRHMQRRTSQAQLWERTKGGESWGSATAEPGRVQTQRSTWSARHRRSPHHLESRLAPGLRSCSPLQSPQSLEDSCLL